MVICDADWFSENPANSHLWWSSQRPSEIFITGHLIDWARKSTWLHSAPARAARRFVGRNCFVNTSGRTALSRQPASGSRAALLHASTLRYWAAFLNKASLSLYLSISLSLSLSLYIYISFSPSLPLSLCDLAYPCRRLAEGLNAQGRRERRGGWKVGGVMWRRGRGKSTLIIGDQLSSWQSLELLFANVNQISRTNTYKSWRCLS